MVKSYLRYERSCSFGVISSVEGNVIYDASGRFAVAPALESAAVWNIRQGNKVRDLQISENSGSGQVTALALSPDGNDVVCGYSSGVICVFKLATGALIVTLDGHKSAVETLTYRSDGAELASGSRDTDVIVWDLVSQTGLFRLKGHKDAVTAVAFLTPRTLVSSSKDTLVKVWDLETQHCLQTCVGHRNEVWSLALNVKGDRLVTGASDNQLRVWSVQQTDKEGEIVKLLGSICRQSNDRVSSVAYHIKGDLVGVQSAGKTVEIYRVRSADEIKKKRQRREKRQREKAKKKQQQVEEVGKKSKPLALHKTQAAKEEEEEDAADNLATDELELLCVVRSSHRVKSFAFSPDVAKDGTTSLMLGLQNNSIETYTLSPSATTLENRYGKSHVLTLSGHRSDVRQVAISSDDQLVLSLAGASVKIWNARSLQCIRTLSDSLSLALSAVFAPGNMHVVVGTKLGQLLLFDLNSGECIWKDEQAHNGSAVWSIDVRPDGRGIVTGGADQRVNFWDFEMHRSDNVEKNSTLRLGLSHTRMLKMSDDVLCVRYSNTKDSKKLVVAVALLDCTVKVFHDDSLKFFVSLYGHKLPVMSMDISSDDAMLVTASADKNVKLWGLDFGDCHKSIFAHQDSIMCVRFVHKTHYFFTASKDKSICYWDGDHFERILKIDGQHFGEVWGLAVSCDGSFVVSCSQDRSLCKYVRTEDQVFIEEEKEKEMEQLFEDELTSNSNNKGPALGKDKSEAGEASNATSAPAAKRTIESVRAGESLMEAIDLAETEVQAIADFARVQKKKLKEAAAAAKKLKQEKKKSVEEATLNALPTTEDKLEDELGELKKLKKASRPPNMLLLGYSPLKYVLQTLRRIRPHDMEAALIVLPFDYVERVIRLLLQLISSHLELEFCCRVLLFLLKLHNSAICARVGLFTELELLWQRLRSQLVESKSRIGFNLAGLKYLKRMVDEERTGFVQEIASTSSSRSKKKRKVVEAIPFAV
uniref:Small-subunit processome Utp12 domain-containing protein n=1 Tax=Peronospora matthiolae TaxID=2874970 RepID=A0AAV1V9J5_9STRA